ncbi:MAG: HEAT repeat domain-containing protein [Oligoflexia bacterium]|nr:HEAT repeat domain-containing protein [Oligoflexia bacterium]
MPITRASFRPPSPEALLAAFSLLTFSLPARSATLPPNSESVTSPIPHPDFQAQLASQLESLRCTEGEKQFLGLRVLAPLIDEDPRVTEIFRHCLSRSDLLAPSDYIRGAQREEIIRQIRWKKAIVLPVLLENLHNADTDIAHVVGWTLEPLVNVPEVQQAFISEIADSASTAKWSAARGLARSSNLTPELLQKLKDFYLANPHFAYEFWECASINKLCSNAINLEPLMLEILRDSTVDARPYIEMQEVVITATEIAPQNPQIREALLALMEKTIDNDFSALVASQLARIAPNYPDVLEHAKRAMASSSGTETDRWLRIIGSCLSQDQEARELTLRLVGSSDLNLRRKAAQMIAPEAASNETLRRALLQRLESPSIPLRQGAAIALGGSVSEPAIRSKLIALLQTDQSSDVREACALTLAAGAGKYPEVDSALINTLDSDPALWVKRSAAQALKGAVASSPAAKRALEAASYDPRWAIGAESRISLAAAAASDSSGVRDFSTALTAPDEAIARAAGEKLGALVATQALTQPPDLSSLPSLNAASSDGFIRSLAEHGKGNPNLIETFCMFASIDRAQESDPNTFVMRAMSPDLMAYTCRNNLSELIAALGPFAASSPRARATLMLLAEDGRGDAMAALAPLVGTNAEVEQLFAQALGQSRGNLDDYEREQLQNAAIAGLAERVVTDINLRNFFITLAEGMTKAPKSR